MSSPFQSHVKALEISTPNAQVHDLLDLNSGEEWIYGQHGVGLYDGNAKLPDHQSLSVQLTTHRLLFLNPTTSSLASGSKSVSPSLQLSLSDVRQTEYYAGFMRSSAKITLFLGPLAGSNDPTDLGSGNGDHALTTQGEWTCIVCGTTNTLSNPGIGTFGSNQQRCTLCGVIRQNETSLPSRSNTPVLAAQRSGSTTPGILSSTALRPTDQAQSDGSGGTDIEISCPRCTFLNPAGTTRCEICTAPLNLDSTSTSIPNATPIPVQNSPTPPRPASFLVGTSLARDKSMTTLRISFRKGGEKEVYKRLKAVLSARAWERKGRDGARRDTGGGIGGEGRDDVGRGVVGIDGILNTISLENKMKQDQVTDAFSDLEALMIRAGEMVHLVQTLNQKLTVQQEQKSLSSPQAGNQGQLQGEDESTQTFLRSSLVQLGLPTPAVTMDMAASDRAYVDGLAQELAGLLTGGGRSEGIMLGKNGRGLVGMDEVWGLWNRARGVSLVSPADFRKTIPLLPTYTKPRVEMMTFPSGLSVLHTPYYHTQIFSARLLRQLEPAPSDPMENSLSTVEIALMEGLSVALAKELIYLVEAQTGSLVRDEQAQEQGGGERWYKNLIMDFKVEDI